MATDEEEPEGFNPSEEDEDDNVCSKLSKKQKNISNRLLDIYDELWENEQLIPKVYIGGSLDTVIAWENTVPNPTYVIPKRRKNTIQEGLTTEESVVEEEDKFKRNYELEFVNCPAWKIGMEPFTYRYMGNNGRYRAYKLARKLMNGSKSKTGQLEMGQLNPDKRLLQREIQRELRREFDSFVKTEREVSALYRQQELAAAGQKQKRKKQEKAPERRNEESEEKKKDEQKHQVKITDSKPENSSDTPRSNISILSSQTPLPPIAVPLLSSERDKTQTKLLSKSMDDLSSIQTESVRKGEKLWQVPGSVNGDNNTEMKGTPRRFEWSSQAVVLQSSSEPPSRTSPRVSRNNKSAPLVKNEQNSGHGLNSGYRLNKLPTISDFNDNEFESSHEYIGQTEMLLGQGYQVKASDKEILQRKGPKRRDDGSSRHQYLDDTVSITSEPVRLKSPILQGTAYDIGRLRASAGQFQQLYPDTVSVVGDIRSVHKENQGHIDDRTALDNMASAGDFHRDPNGIHDFSVFGKQNNLKIKEESAHPQDLSKIISTRQYVNTKTRTGLNPYLRKPKPGSNALHQQLFTMEEPNIAQTLATIPLNDPTPGLSNHVQRGDVMPEMMVRRAGLSLSNKRVI